jgi:hypothetical protein
VKEGLAAIEVVVGDERPGLNPHRRQQVLRLAAALHHLESLGVVKVSQTT